MAFTNIWDNTFPADTQLANLLGQDLRSFRLDTQQRMASMSGLDAAKPNFAGDAQPANWNGILFFATDTGKIYKFANPAWTDITSNFYNGGVNRYSQNSTSTNAAGQNLFSVTIPVGVLKIGSVIHICETHLRNTNMNDFIQIGTTGFDNVGGGPGPYLRMFDCVVSSNTQIVVSGISGLPAGLTGVVQNAVVSNITTTALTIFVQQFNSGILSGYAFTVVVNG